MGLAFVEFYLTLPIEVSLMFYIELLASGLPLNNIFISSAMKNQQVEVVKTSPELGLAIVEFYLTLPIELLLMFDNKLLAP